ncbi:MAG: serine/threonine protein kinase [Eubacterium sp.]|nr:serine/threonine protein kinase [Eubacterium sp.]
MDITEICKGCFSKKDEGSFTCKYCEYENGIVDEDETGWKTGMLLSKRYLLGRLFMKKQDYAMWRAYDKFLGVNCAIVVPEKGPKSGLTFLAWGSELRKAESSIKVMALKGVEGRWALVLSLRDSAITRKDFIKEIHISKENPNTINPFNQSSNVPSCALPKDTMIGKNYKILGVLGAEKVSISYLCKDILLERMVKIKEYFPEEWASREADGSVTVKSSRQTYAFNCGREGFMKECRMTAQFLHSPFFPTIFDYFTTNNTDYMVSEFIEGTNIENEFAKRDHVPYSVDEVITIMEPVLEGLQLLHNNRIVHCNITPGNIMRATNGQIMLTSLGASKYQDTETSVMSATFLKPDYAAPEQYKNDGENEEGPWTDVYQVGMVMYYLLIGHKPTDVLTRMERDSAELVNAKKYKVKLKKGWMNLLVESTELDYHFRIQSAEELLAKMKKRA